MASKRGGKKSKGKKNFTGDVTLADYANASVSTGTGRLRKSKTFSIAKEVELLSVEDKSWDEKVDDYEGDFDFVKEENEDGQEVFVMKKIEKPGKRALVPDGCETEEKGNFYPIDIWHLIAKHIEPEDVAVFSAICRDARSVINSPTFWKNLYKRYYRSRHYKILPDRLKPECIMRLRGLKACVVRSLFYTYPPFSSKVERSSLSTSYNLKSRQCISVWQEKHCSKWRLNIKFKRKDYKSNSSLEEKPDLLELLSDIFANPDDGCSVLQVVSAERMAPVGGGVLGLTLHNININMDIMLTHMSLQLVFGSGRICNGKLDPVGTVTVSLKNVQNVNVLDWWHPHYPHSPFTISRPDDT